ncbi:hypothetical protein HK104_006442 [Borealophlyctis nickersoniae]|nr:hypothetical protein HK104_006442 [Borealophlyctis nickersoniae]
MLNILKLLAVLAIISAAFDTVKCNVAELPEDAEEVILKPAVVLKAAHAAVLPVIKHASGGRHAKLRDLFNKTTNRLAVRSDVNIEQEVHPLLVNARQADPLTTSADLEGAIQDVADKLLHALPDVAGGEHHNEYHIGSDDTVAGTDTGAEDGKSKKTGRKLGGGGKKRRGVAATSGSPTIVGGSNYYDSIYFTNINLGTAGGYYSVVMDTGSADLWVPSVTCSSAVCSTRRRYDPKLSRTSYVLNKTCTVRYGLGSATGIVAQDTARFGMLEATGQVFIMASSMNNHQPDEVDGLLGLGFSALSWANSVVPSYAKGKSAIIENLYNQGKILRPAFGIWFSPMSQLAGQTNAVGGEIAIGSELGDPKRYTGAIRWLSVPDTSNWWHVAVTQVKAGSGSGTIAAGRNVRGVVDTGTALIVTDYNTAATLNKALGAYDTGIYGLWGLDCDTARRSNVVITFTLQGMDFPLTGPDFPVQVYPDDTSMCYAPFMCAPGANTTDRFILGEVFLRKYYAIYDYNPDPTTGKPQPRVGLALSVQK